MSQEWADELTSGRVSRRRAAAQRLAQTTVAPQSLPLLVRAAGDPDEQVRAWVAAALEQAGPPAGEVLADLIPLLADPHDDVAYWAATLTGRLGEAAAAAAPALAELLGAGRSEAVCERAAWALGCIGPLGGCALPVLEETAQRGGPRLARLAGRAIEMLQGH